jgi:tetratricopeptide (TPR) repeat protein
MQGTDGVSPPDAHAQDYLPSEKLGNETVRDVVLQMLKRCARDIADALRWQDDAKLSAGPLVAAAVSRNLMTQRALAGILSVPEAAISRMKGGRPSKLDDLALERALRDVAARWRTAVEAHDLAEALRWRWTTIGDWVGVSDRAIASATGLSRSRINAMLNQTTPAQADDYRRIILEGLGRTPPAPSENLEDLVQRLMLVHAADTYPDDPDVLFTAGWFFDQLGAVERAQEYYERAARDGSNPCAAHNLAIVHENHGDLEQAEEWFVEADKRGHRCTNTTYHGRFLLAQGRIDDALRVWIDAADRGVAAAARCMAEHLHEHDEHEEEALWWEHAAELGDSAGLRARGWRSWDQGDQQGAERAYLQAAKLGDSAAACWIGRQLMTREPELALTVLEQASQAGHAGATEALICVLHTRNPRRALSACRELARQGGTPPRVHYALLLEEVEGSSHAQRLAYEQWLAEIADLAGDRVSASAASSHWEPEPAMAYGRAGRLARLLGDERAAQDLLWHALETADAAIINSALTELAELDREPDQSLDEALREVVDEALSLGHHQVALPLADALKERGERPEAVEIVRRARRRVPKGSTLAAELEAAQLITALPSRPDEAVVIETIRRLKRCARDQSRRAFMFLGAYYMRNMSDEPRDALACFQWLVEHGEPYHRELAEALSLCGDPGVAEVLDEGIAEGEIECYALRGIICEQQGRLDDALKAWQEGARAGDGESGVHAGQALQRAGKIPEARAMLRRTAKHGCSCAWSALGTLEYEQNGRAASLKHFRQAMMDGCYHGTFNLAAALLASNAPTAASRAEALSALRKVLQADPNHLKAAQLLASATAEEGAPELSAVLYATALEDRAASRLIAALDAAHHPDRRIRRTARRWRRRWGGGFWRRRG